MQTKSKSRLKIRAYLRDTIDRKIGMMLSCIRCMERNWKEVFALDANRLIDKIVEKGLNVTDALFICNKIADQENLTIGDAMKIKEMLSLTNLEAIEVFYEDLQI